MARHDFSKYTYETNMPPGVGAELAIRTMAPWSYTNLGRNVFQFAKRSMKDPDLRAAIREKAAQLQAEGFFDAHPAEEVTPDVHT